MSLKSSKLKNKHLVESEKGNPGLIKDESLRGSTVKVHYTTTLATDNIKYQKQRALPT